MYGAFSQEPLYIFQFYHIYQKFTSILILIECIPGNCDITSHTPDNNAANPLRGTWHYEDGKRTEGDKCTYKNKQSKNQQNEKQENKVKQNEETIDEKSAKDKIDIKQYIGNCEICEVLVRKLESK